MTQVFETTDPEAGQEFCVRAYGQNRLHIDGIARDFRLRCARTDAGSFQHDDFEQPFDVTHTTDALQSLLVVHVIGGLVERDTDGASERFGPGDTFLMARPDRPHKIRLQQAHLDMINIPLAVLRQVAGRNTRFTGYRPASTTNASTWRATARFASELIDDATSASPLVADGLGRLLAATALATFPNTAQPDPTTEDRHDAHPNTVRRAVAFIEAYPDLDITVADIARAAFVTPRAIQFAFRRHLDSTPLGYLRRVRLDRARADLLAATPGDGSTVTGVAARWGWARPSRFAADYRAAYARHPSQDLRA